MATTAEMLTQDQDFVCDTSAGIILCKPLTAETASTYKVLQLQLARLLPQIPGVKTRLDIDGIVGPTVALAVQMVFTRIAQGQPAILNELGQLIYAPAEQAIVGVAQHADSLSVYIDRILTANPNAVRSPPPLTGPAPEDPIATLKRIFTKKRIVAGAMTIAGLGGLAAVATASSARALGRVDRSHFLPESDGTDEMGDDSDDDSDDDVIDVEAHEHVEHETPRLALPAPEA